MATRSSSSTLRGLSGTGSSSSNLSAGLKRPGVKGAATSKAPARLQPLPGSDPATVASKTQGKVPVTDGRKTPPVGTNGPSKRATATTALKPLPGKKTVRGTTTTTTSTTSSLSSRPSSVGLVSGAKPKSVGTASNVLSSTLPPSSSKAAAGLSRAEAEDLEKEAQSQQPSAEPKAAFGSVESSPASNRAERTAESDHDDDDVDDVSDDENGSEYDGATSSEEEGEQTTVAVATPQKPTTSSNSPSPASAAPQNMSPSKLQAGPSPPTAVSPQRPAGAAPAAVSPAKARVGQASSPGAKSMMALIPDWPKPTEEQLALLNGRKMEPRTTGEYTMVFPKSGVFACLKCRAAVAGATSKIRADGVYATFDRYCAANLVTELKSAMQETLVLVLCKKCHSFLGNLTYDGPTETGEMLKLNSGCIRYCDVRYTGIDTTFDQWEEAGGGDGDNDDEGDILDAVGEDELMYLDEEEIKRRKAAAWGRSGSNLNSARAAH